MNKVLKHVLWIIPILALFICLTATTASAAPTSGKCGERLEWKIEGKALTITGFGIMDDYDTENHPGWYDSRTSIESVDIAPECTTIGSYAFSDLTALKSVTMGNKIEVVMTGAFYGCKSLEKITLSETVAAILPGAFYRCGSLTSITIPKKVTTIDTSAFRLCGSLEKIIFKGNAPTIAGNAFTNVTATVYYPYGNSSWNEYKDRKSVV